MEGSLKDRGRMENRWKEGGRVEGRKARWVGRNEEGKV